MNTLQRSSCSFRRQGSSGRIWQDMPFMEPKSGSLSPKKNQVKEESVSQGGSNIVVGTRTNENKIAANSPPSSRNNQNKVHNRSFLSSICGMCMNSPTNRD
ncbi:unnamed protein product [Lathyrus oleraceus]